MKKKLKVIVVLAFALGLSSCSSYIPTYYYMIDTDPEFEKADKPLPVSVTVGTLRSPSRYQDRMVYRKSRYEMGFYEYSEWIEPPAEMVTRAVVNALDASGLFSRVDTLDFTPGTDLIVLGEITRFDQEVQGEENFADCELLLELVRADGEEVTWRYRAKARVKQEKEGEFAAAMSEAVRRALADAVSDMERSDTLRKFSEELGKSE